MALAFSTLQDALTHSEMLRQEAMTQARQALGNATDAASNATYSAAVQNANSQRDDRTAAARAAFIGTAAAIPANAKPNRSGAQTWLTSTKVDNGS